MQPAKKTRSGAAQTARTAEPKECGPLTHKQGTASPRTGTSPAQGIHGSGGRSYKAHEARLVAAELKYATGLTRAVTVEYLARATGIGGRAVRQILSDFDGVWYLLGGGDDGYYVCEWADEGDSFTRRMRSQVTTMQERVTRRSTFAATLPTQQGDLFGDH